MGSQAKGHCEHCKTGFAYEVVHCGFGDCSYAYCDTCGRTAILSFWHKEFPKCENTPLNQGEIDSRRIQHLKPCECGGNFQRGSSPRCPHCREVLSAELASAYIEQNAPGTAKGWRWQGNWRGLYCIVVEDKVVRDNYRS